MPVLKLIRGAAVLLATIGVVMPLPSAQADESVRKSVRPAAATVFADVKKGVDGQFAGRVVDHNGAVVENADVIIRQNNVIIGRARTDEEGMFSVKNLKPGAYQVSSGTTEGLFRVWNDKSAPPSARANALLVLGENGQRGQYGGMDEYPMGGYPGLDPTLVLLTAGVIGAVVLSALTYSKVNSSHDTTTIIISP